jgi:putative oligomerization/nucleic acid binding protein
LSEDLIKQVQRLIDSGKGDSTRLHEIFSTIKQGSPLYLSDYKYLESLSADVEKFKQESEANEKKLEFKSKSQKKSERMKKSEKIQSKEDTALKILKNRLASGEITIAEFNELKKIIKET